MYDSITDLVDPYSAAHGAHASEVSSAASAVVEGHISTRTTEDRQRESWRVRSKSEPN